MHMSTPAMELFCHGKAVLFQLVVNILAFGARYGYAEKMRSAGEKMERRRQERFCAQNRC